MKARSSFSKDTDPYRAGLQLGQDISSVQPEVVFLFSTIHYRGSAELLEGLLDGLSPLDPLVLGCTGDGFYECHAGWAAMGAAAMGLNSQGRLSWRLSRAGGLEQAPGETTRRCMKGLLDGHEEKGRPSFCFLTSDFRTDTQPMVEELSRWPDVPFVGGTAGDDRLLKRSFVHANRETLEDHVAMLAAWGDVPFAIRLARRCTPVGKEGTVEDAEGPCVKMIGGTTAMDFIVQQTGKPLDVVDQGVVNFALSRSTAPDGFVTRSVFMAEPDGPPGSVKLPGGVAVGDKVRVCINRADSLLEDFDRFSRSLTDLPFTPTCGILTSCAGRLLLLDTQASEEVRRITKACPELKSLVGFPSFGEFGPLVLDGRYSETMFHNMTAVVLLFGEETP